MILIFIYIYIFIWIIPSNGESYHNIYQIIAI